VGCSPNFAIGSGKKPGTLVVTIPKNVEWKLIGKQTQVFHNIEFATADNETISTVRWQRHKKLGGRSEKQQESKNVVSSINGLRGFRL
jgi:hypothetical protein